jgi:hypothetical protein
MYFQSFIRFKTNRSKIHYSYESYSFAVRSFPLVEFLHEIPDAIWTKGVVWSSLFRPVGSSPAAMEWRRSSRGPLRTRRTTQPDPRWPAMAWPTHVHRRRLLRSVLRRPQWWLGMESMSAACRRWRRSLRWCSWGARRLGAAGTRVATVELCGGHGGSALERPESEEEDGEGEVSEEEWWSVSCLSKIQEGAAGVRGGEVGVLLMHGWHVGITSNTWWARSARLQGPKPHILGRFGSERLNKISSPLLGLQLWFRVYCH